VNVFVFDKERNACAMFQHDAAKGRKMFQLYKSRFFKETCIAALAKA